jgi:putative peptidoglycan lipid II flippase
MSQEASRTSKLLQSTAVTGGMTLISRISGLARDTVFAGALGASISPVADAFYVAFRIPNLFRRFSGEGAFSQAFVPVMSEYRQLDHDGEARQFVSHMAGRFAVILFIITLLGVIGAPVLVMVLAPGFLDDGPKFDMTVSMVRVMFPYMMFVSLVAMAAGILNSYSRFAAAAFTPVLLNLVLIVAAIWGAGHFSDPVQKAEVLAGGVFIAGVIQLIFQFPFLMRIRMLPRPRLGRHEGVSRVFRLMLPAMFGSSVSQLNIIVITVLASFLATGSVSWLYFSNRLVEFPMGVFGIALATVLLPSLSRQHAVKDPESFSRLLDWAMRLGFIIGAPAAAALIVLAGPILATLFFHKQFLAIDVEKTMYALWASAAGLLGLILTKVLAPGFYARQDTRTPAKIAAVAFAVNIIMSLVLIGPMRHVGLAAAVSIAAYTNALMLFAQLLRTGVLSLQPGWSLLLVQVGISTTTMTALLVWGVGDWREWLHMSLVLQVRQLLLWVIAGFTTYVITMLILGIRPRHLHSPAHT